MYDGMVEADAAVSSMPRGTSKHLADDERIAAVASDRGEGAESTPRKSSWALERVARLGFLIGQGFGAERIAKDAIIASTPNNVYRQAYRFGLSFRDAAAARISADVEKALDAAAEKRQITRDALVKTLLTVAALEPNLIDNILDDDA